MKKSLIGCSVVLLALVLTPMVLLIYPWFKLGDVGRCRANLKKIHRALVAYAKKNDGWFPAENNDLRPLFTTKCLNDTDAKLFHCPGRKDVFAGTENVKGSLGSGQTFPPGMSYLYQGGLGLPEEEDPPGRIMWDRSPRHHGGKGINVLYSDGTVKFRKGLSRIRLRRIDPEW